MTGFTVTKYLGCIYIKRSTEYNSSSIIEEFLLFSDAFKFGLNLAIKEKYSFLVSPSVIQHISTH